MTLPVLCAVHTATQWLEILFNLLARSPGYATLDWVNQGNNTDNPSDNNEVRFP